MLEQKAKENNVLLFSILVIALLLCVVGSVVLNIYPEYAKPINSCMGTIFSLGVIILAIAISISSFRVRRKRKFIGLLVFLPIVGYLDILTSANRL